MQHARTYFAQAELMGVDVFEESLNFARSCYGNIAQFFMLTGGDLPTEVCALDAAYAMCVFHHIDETMHVDLLSKVRSRLKTEGLLMVYKHNPFNPLTVRVVNNCPFDENAKLIQASLLAKRCQEAGFRNVRVKYRVFFPGFLKGLRLSERLLTWLPLGGQYYVRGIA
jgi:SAM-dependent methyltransferase